MTKIIELTGDWDIPEGYTNKAEIRKAAIGDFIVCGIYGEKNEILECGHGCHGAIAPCLIPERKVIDWKKIIDNKVLCEFSAYESFEQTSGAYLIGHLKSFYQMFQVVEQNCSAAYTYCRPAQNILFGHNGGECPLPEGVRVKARIYSYESGHGLHDDGGWRLSSFTADSIAIDWREVVSYEILGLSAGYSYE